MVRIKLPLAFTALIFFCFLSWQCTKIDTTNLGGGLIPAVDNVNTFDTTLSIIANNYDSVLLGKGCTTIYPTDEHALGYIGNDPLFGTTTATIYTELKPATFPFYFQAKNVDRTLDSVVLVLNYKRTYGDSTLAQSVVVHEIFKGFSPDSSTCSVYPFNAPSLGSATYIPQRLMLDSVKTVDKDTTVNQLRIKLSAAFGQSLLSQDTLQTDSAFMAFFKGFAIVPDKAGNALTYFGITDAATKLVVYYKYKRTGLADTTDYKTFNLLNGDRSANNIVRDHSTAEVKNFSNTNSNPAGDNFIYVETSPGTIAQLKIDGLTGLSNRIVHRAELIIDQVKPTVLDKILAPPPFLFLDIKDTSAFYHPVPCDFTVVSGLPDISTYGGFKTMVKNAAGDSVARYVFNISRYVQKIVTNHRSNSTLRLWAPAYVTTPLAYVDDCNVLISPLLFAMNNVAQGRVKIVGGKFSPAINPNAIRLHIIYSKL